MLHIYHKLVAFDLSEIAPKERKNIAQQSEKISLSSHK